MSPRRFAAALALVLLLASSGAAADPRPTHIVTEEPRLICIPPMPVTTCRELPPGHFVDQVTWTKLDDVLKDSQNDVTRLRAENGKLRDSVSGWTPGWKTLATALLVGLAGGWYAHSKL